MMVGCSCQIHDGGVFLSDRWWWGVPVRYMMVGCSSVQIPWLWPLGVTLLIFGSRRFPFFRQNIYENIKMSEQSKNSSDITSALMCIKVISNQTVCRGGHCQSTFFLLFLLLLLLLASKELLEGNFLSVSACCGIWHNELFELAEWGETTPTKFVHPLRYFYLWPSDFYCVIEIL